MLVAVLYAPLDSLLRGSQWYCMHLPHYISRLPRRTPGGHSAVSALTALYLPGSFSGVSCWLPHYTCQPFNYKLYEYI